MPSAPLLYLLKAHAVLLLFAAAYFGLLRPLTFFALNRAYLAGALLFAAAYPALPVPALWPAAAPAPAVAWVLAELPAGAPAAALPAPGPDWPAWLLAGYAAGAALLLGRLLVQLLALARLHRAARPAVAPGGVAYRRLAGGGGPFSFGRTIYLNPAQHPAPAELAAVLAHEQAHVRQGHTLDVLLAHVATAVFWLSPAAWLLRRALLDNLEYLADAATLRTGLDRRAYQYSLLRLGPPAGSPALVSPFSLSTLKNRILMMNRPVSNRLQLLRYALAGPLVVAAALAFSGAQAEPVPLPAVAPEAPKPLPSDVVYYVDGQLVASDALSVVNPESIGSINVLKGKEAEGLTGKATGSGAILVTTKGHENSPEVLAFNEKVRRMAPRRMGIKDHSEARVMRAGAIRVSAVAASKVKADTALTLVKADTALAFYYVDGKLMDGTLVNNVKPKGIANVLVVKGPPAQKLLSGISNTGSVVVITTIAGKDLPAAVEFNSRIEKMMPTYATAVQLNENPIAKGRAVPISYVAAPALAYITKNYPDSRITGVTELKNAKNGQLNYRVEVTKGRRPQYAVFDAQGQPVTE